MAAVLPGQPLQTSIGALPDVGQGVFSRDGRLYSSSVGLVKQQGSTVQVINNVKGHRAFLPDTGSIVVGVITRLQRPHATMSIQTVDNQVLEGGDFQGIIRTQDVRQTQKDSVKIYSCFRPGDTVRAKVLSPGDVRSFFLSTAENDLGVIHGISADGNALVPVSWESMRDPITDKQEPRKVASPSSTV